MHNDFIILIVIFSILQSNEQTKTIYPLWRKYFIIALSICIILLILETSIDLIRPVTVWIALILTFFLFYLSYIRKEFLPIKSLSLALLPLVVVNLIEQATILINQSTYTAWQNYFETASSFAFIWLVAMLIISRRQRKALEKERLKAEAKEKEYQQAQFMKAELENLVVERTGELTLQKEELIHALDDLKSTQAQLIQSEKMASLGELTAGIAHEIKNPLNFVNNFAEVNNELIEEMIAEIDKGDMEEVKAIASDIKQNLEKINNHGKRADAIVKGMLEHSRTSDGEKTPTDINALSDEYLRLAYHGLRAKDKSFNATMKTDFDDSIEIINIITQDIGRVILNLITNAFYAVSHTKLSKSEEFAPTVWLKTKKTKIGIEISVKDNGNGIPSDVLDKIFQPFFTTKPTGEGTGLGLSMSYDIITNGHGGTLKVESIEGEGSIFTIVLPNKF
ncbi:MAG: ATP-binding protein [Saprospiraceae bacterium]